MTAPHNSQPTLDQLLLEVGSLQELPPWDPSQVADRALQSLRELASAARSGTTGGTSRAGTGGGLADRIAAARAQVVGARGPVTADRVRTALARTSGPTDVLAGTILLPSAQRVLSAHVTAAADAATAILSALRPIREALVDPAEVAAVVGATRSTLAALRREAVEPEPREELVAAKRVQLVHLRERLLELFASDDDFTSAADLEQTVQLGLLEGHVASIEGAYVAYFHAQGGPVAVDLVPIVQAQLRVVGDTVAELRSRLAQAGASEFELAAPDARLSELGEGLPTMTLARFLDWITDYARGTTAADLPTTGGVGLDALRRERDRIQPIVDQVVGIAGHDAGHAGAVALALGDAGVQAELAALGAQLRALPLNYETEARAGARTVLVGGMR